MLLLALALQVAGPVVRAEEPGALVRAVAWSADRLVAAHRRGDAMFVVVRDARTGNVLSRTPEFADGNLAVSPASAALSSRDGRVRILSLPDGRELSTLESGGPHPRLALTPDGRLAATSSRPLRVWDAGTGKPAAELESSTNAGTLVFSKDGALVAATQAPQGVGVWDAATGRRLLLLDAPFHCADHLAFSPDGRHLAYAAPDGLLRVWSIPDGELAGSLPGKRFRPTFSPDGRRLAVTEPDLGIRLLSFPSLAPAGVVGRHTAYPIAMAFSPDGTRLASGHSDGALRIWALPAPRKVVLLAAEPDDHPPGTHLYAKNARVVQRGLEAAYGPAVKVELHAKGWPDDPATLDDADAIFLTSAGSDRKLEMHPFHVGDRMAAVARQMRRGCGLLFFHWSTFHPAKHHDLVTDWVGGYFDYETGPGPRKWYSAIETREWSTVLPAPEHPIARGVKPFKVQEEFYFRIRFRENDPRLVPFLLCREGDARENAVGWAVERADGGRGVGFTGGHTYRNWANADFRKLLLNAVAWTAKLEVPAGGVESAFEDETDPDRARVTLSFKDAPLKQVLDAVSRRTGIRIELDDAAKGRLGDEVSVDVQDLVVSGALRLLALPMGLEIEVVPGGVRLRGP
jgi:WD40 repeat protein/trehalose utilization protein